MAVDRIARRAVRLRQNLINRAGAARNGVMGRAAAMQPRSYAIPFDGRTISFPVFDPHTYRWFFRYRGVTENGWHEPSLTRLFERLAPRRRCLVDVGAHLGYFSALFAAAPDRMAYAIEMDPVNEDYLQRSLAGLRGIEGTVRPFHLGLAAEAGEIWLDSRHASPRASLMEAASSNRNGTRVELTTLDAFCRRAAIEPDVVKIDVEGLEREVWRGGAEVWARCRPVVVMEIHTRRLQRQDIDAAAFLDEIRAAGYRLFSCAGHRSRMAEPFGPLAGPRDAANYDIVCVPDEADTDWLLADRDEARVPA